MEDGGSVGLEYLIRIFYSLTLPEQAFYNSLLAPIMRPINVLNLI